MRFPVKQHALFLTLLMAMTMMIHLAAAETGGFIDFRTSDMVRQLTPSDTIPYPWNTIELTGAKMKPLPVAATTGKGGGALIPIIAGAVGVTTLVIVLFEKREDEVCNISATATATSATCGQANGSITLAVPIEATYAWSNGSTAHDLINIPPGLYSVTIAETGTLCMQVLEQNVPDEPLHFEINSLITDAECGKDNGSATLIFDPPGLYSAAWSTGDTTLTVEKLSPGNYSVTVTSTGTCREETTVAIGEQAPIFEAVFVNTASECGQNNGSSIAQIVPPTEVDFLWSTGATLSTISDAAPGIYMVTITEQGTSCQIVRETTIEELPAGYTLSFSTQSETCGLSDGQAELTVDPPGNYAFLWSNGQTSSMLTNVAAGSYQVTVTVPETNCSKTGSVTIDQLPPAFSITTNTTDAHCGLADGTANITITPDGNYELYWSGGQTGSTVNDLLPGTYTVTISLSGTKCSKSTEVTIGELPPAFTLTISSTTSSCSTADGTATVTPDPPGTYEYHWSDGQSTPTATGLGAGSYTVRVSLPGSKCSITDSVTVEQNMPNFTGSVSGNPADCGVANGSASIMVDPPANYTYVWSNKSASEAIANISAGTYTVTVTDDNGCTASYGIDITALPPNYIAITGTASATCLGGGDIGFALSTPGIGPLNVQVEGPQGTMPVSLAPGSYMLSSFINVVPGSYTFSVFDESIGMICTATTQAIVGDDSPMLLASNDQFSTTFETPVSENILSNDSGLNIIVSSTSNETGGSVTFSADGNFTFTPAAGFSGTASFTYTVTDACGQTGTAVVSIEVAPVNCNYSISPAYTPAHCSLDDGSIEVTVNEPGNYQYTWNTGASGMILSDVVAGNYTVSIEEVNLGCLLTFDLVLPEYPADYLSNLVVNQPTCTAPGGIQFDVSAPQSGDLLTMSVTHPGGMNTFQINEGPVALIDYVPMVPGNFSVEIFIGNVGATCIDGFTVTLNASPGIVLALDGVTPPSSPSAADGTATITATTPGQLPYIIYVDGNIVGTTAANTFTIANLVSGDHDVQVEDVTGCLSNVLIVTIPPSTIILSFGTLLNPIDFMEEVPEHANIYGHEVNTAIISTVDIPVGQHRYQFLAIASLDGNNPQRWMTQIEQRMDLLHKHNRHFTFRLEAGIGVRAGDYNRSTFSPAFLSANARVAFNISKQLKVTADWGIRGWKHLEPYPCQIDISLPFGLKTR